MGKICFLQKMRKWNSIVFLVIVFLTTFEAWAFGNPETVITKNSECGDTNGFVWGKVTGINKSDYKKYRVLVYIKVNNTWWSKPYCNAQLTKISRTGRWKCDITTGGEDEKATNIIAYLVSKKTVIPECSLNVEILPDIDFADTAELERRCN